MKKHRCCICKGRFVGFGNNPAPVKTNGVCCDECNWKYVIPARLDACIKNMEESRKSE